MKITEHPDGSLTVEDRPWGAGLAAVGMAVLSAGGVWAWYNGSASAQLGLVSAGMFAASVFAVFFMIARTRLTLDAGAGTVRLLRQGGSASDDTWPVAEVEGASLEKVAFGKNAIVKLHVTGRDPLPFADTNKVAEAVDAAMRVDRWIKARRGEDG